jgi:hypothetical protein
MSTPRLLWQETVLLMQALKFLRSYPHSAILLVTVGVVRMLKGLLRQYLLLDLPGALDAQRL